MPVRACVAGVPRAERVPEGLYHEDAEALTRLQRACAGSLAAGVQMKQEAYLTQHPEVKAMLEIFVCKVAKAKPRRAIMAIAAEHFTRPAEELDREIREHLKLPRTGPYYSGKSYSFSDEQLARLLQRTRETNVWLEPATLVPPASPHPSTLSSPFASVCTSNTTVPTPEPVPTPPETLPEHLYGMVSHTVDKAIFLHVDDQMLLYDTVYVELMHAVEEAMEVPVVELREDLAEMLHQALLNCEMEILEKERIARDLAIANRVRKVVKKSLREISNFRGYMPPPRSVGSSTPPPRPAVVEAEAAVAAPRGRPTYNRYDKDRFGVWRSACDAQPGNATETPLLSEEHSEADAAASAAGLT